jgi:hypothetical protein
LVEAEASERNKIQSPQSIGSIETIFGFLISLGITVAEIMLILSSDILVRLMAPGLTPYTPSVIMHGLFHFQDAANLRSRLFSPPPQPSAHVVDYLVTAWE